MQTGGRLTVRSTLSTPLSAQEPLPVGSLPSPGPLLPTPQQNCSSASTKRTSAKADATRIRKYQYSGTEKHFSLRKVYKSPRHKSAPVMRQRRRRLGAAAHIHCFMKKVALHPVAADIIKEHLGGGSEDTQHSLGVGPHKCPHSK